MRLEEIADVVVGQIMTRVNASEGDNEQDKKMVKVLVPKAIVEGVVNIDDLGEATINKEIDKDKYTKEGDIVIKLSTPYDAAFIEKDNSGLVIPSFCAAIRIKDGVEYDAQYLTAVLNSQYIREILKSKIVGAARPMIKVTDLRALKLSKPSVKDMKDIGLAYVLSGKKKSLLKNMIDAETAVMEGVVLKSIKEGEY